MDCTDLVRAISYITLIQLLISKNNMKMLKKRITLTYVNIRRIYVCLILMDTLDI